MHRIKPGAQLEIDYPTQRHILYVAGSPLQRREITIRHIRDLVSDPLTPQEFLRRPYLSRSRWLVHAAEQLPDGHSQQRQFYLGNSPQYRRPGTLRLAWYRPGDRLPVEILSREFQPTIEDRRVMVQMLRWLQRNSDDDDLYLRIIADDFRLIA